MFKIKLLAGLAGLVTALVVLAAPAMAEFKSTNGQTRGPIKTFPETTTFQGTATGAKIECKSASGEPKGEWEIQVKTQTQQGKYKFQAEALEGPHEQLKIDKWGTCTGPTGIPAKVKCSLQVEIGSQNGNPLSAEFGSGSVYPTIGQNGATGCEVTLQASEGGNFCKVFVDPNGNSELRKVTITNGGGGVEITPNVSGITSTTQESGTKCTELGVAGGQGTGKFTAKGPLITEGQELTK